MITDKDKAIELVSKDWSEYFNLAEDLRENEEILNIVLRADDLFANGQDIFIICFGEMIEELMK